MKSRNNEEGGGHVAYMGEKRNAYRVLAEKPSYQSRVQYAFSYLSLPLCPFSLSL
jgi:hypothetical protein